MFLVKTDGAGDPACGPTHWVPAPGRTFAVSLVIVLSLAVYAALLAANGASSVIPPTCAIFLCSALSGIVGFAFSALGQPALAPLMHDPVRIVQTLMVCSLANQAFSIAALWRHMQWSRLPAFVIGGLTGLPVGIYLLMNLAPRDFHIAVGAIILAYGAYIFVRRPIALPNFGPLADGAIGALGGVIGGLSAFPGAPVTIWCSMKGWTKTEQRGVYQPYILMMQVGGLALLTIFSGRGGHSGPLAAEGALATMAIVPGSLAGTWFGLRVFRRISDRAFEACMAGLLMASGVLLLI